MVILQDILNRHEASFKETPISSYGFLIIIELLAIMIRSNKNIEGININGVKNLLALFADDMNIFMLNKEKSWQELTRMLRYFEQISGMKVNYDKSTIYRLGSAKKSISRDYAMGKIRWSDKANVLGVTVTTSEKLMDENFNPLIEKSEKILNLWMWRNLSLIGKVVIINTLVASLYVHKLAALPFLQPDHIKRYQKVILNFLWDGKRSKININILQGHKFDGGLGLVDIGAKDRALKLQWIFRINKNEVLKALAYDLLENCIGDYIWEINLDPKEIACVTNQNNTWVNILEQWLKIVHVNPQERGQITSQIIWYNSFIRIEEKPVFWMKWFKRGIIRNK